MSFFDDRIVFRDLPVDQTHTGFQSMGTDSFASRSFGDPFSTQVMRSIGGAGSGFEDAVMRSSGGVVGFEGHAQSGLTKFDTSSSYSELNKKMASLGVSSGVPAAAPHATKQPAASLVGGLAEEAFPEAHQLDPVPSYFEKYSSFFTQSAPAILLLHLNAIFTAMEGVDHDLKPSKCKIKGFANGIAGRCAFKVSLFWQRDTRVLCEFQRRSGTLPSGSDAKTALDTETVNRLIAMAGCDNVDVQREGSGALAAVSLHNTLTQAFAQLLGLLDKLMLNNDDELCRNACVCLANLCTFEESRVPVLTALLPRMCDVLSEPYHISRRDSKRQVARALLECSRTPACKKMLAGSVTLLKRFEASSDLALQASITGTLEQIRTT